MNLTTSACPKCGREEQHDSKKHLAQCSICVMRGADAIAQAEEKYGQDIRTGKELKHEN